MKKRNAVNLCAIVSLLVVFICIAVCFATYSRYSLGVVTQISIKDKQSSTYVLQLKYLFASGGYSVRNVPENEEEYTGDGLKDYDGTLGEYRILIEFGDLALEDSFNKIKDENGIIHLSKDFRARVAYPSDHGFVLYVGCDKPMRIETIEGVRLNPFGGTIKIPISIVDINRSTEHTAGETPSETVRVSIPDLTMATLKSLVNICEEDLTWDTFAPYWYKDISSGIYTVLRYPIDVDYCLVISGASMEEPPEKIILEALHSPENCIDIRTESIDAFIATGIATNATLAAKEKILNAALEHCKTRYDYTDVHYFFDSDEWYVEFWENEAKIAAQRVTLDKDGNILGISYAE